jgi:mono/diheme cytochrome c family protein/glucose/arabinose dehydrogenase
MAHSFRKIKLNEIWKVFSNGLVGTGLLSLLGFMVISETIQNDVPSPARTPAQELATFQVESGLKVQLVASEPMVQDPVIIHFDEDGRLWVVEMRGFMPTIDGEGETERVGRLSVLEDKNGDGKMDVSTVFLDKLVMPRAMALVLGGVLIAENNALWFAKDTDGNLKADSKILIDSTYARNGLPEHTDNGLWRGIDNWYYNAKSRLRYRLEDGKWQRDSTEFRGQWGMSHDDEGRLYYNYNWSQLHADLVPPNYLSKNKNHTPTSGIDHGLTIDRRVYPIRPNPAVNRGYIPGTLDSMGRLLEFTAACSPLVYRGMVFPKAYQGNVFVCEPSGNLIKRNVVEKKGFMVSAYDPHPGKEFLASTDERFRPVHLTTGSDGAIYIADMYRGLIQHGAYVTPYLRQQTINRKLTQPIHRGRIWRVVPDNWKPSKPKKLSTSASEELVANLSHPDGWQRDMAQRLLVERNDRKMMALLEELAINGKDDLGRFHALWTLQGLKWANTDLLFKLLFDKNALIGSTALRLLEPIAQKEKAIRERLGDVLLKGWEQTPIEQTLQIALSARVLDPQTAQPLLLGIIERYGTYPLMRDAVMSSLPNQEFAFLERLLKSPNWQTTQAEREIFLEMLTTAIVRKREVKEMTALLAKLDVDKASFGWQQKTILTAMAIQSKNRKLKPVQLAAAPPLFARSDFGTVEKKRLQTLEALFEWPGHTAQFDNTQKSLLNEEQQQLFALGRQHYLTTCAGCHGSDGAGLNRFGPPLIESDWVMGDEKRLSLIVLHGMEGPLDVAGKLYDVPDILPVMPSHSTMDDGAIMAILTYIRNEWGNNAGPVSRGIVGKTRHTSQGRVVPWTVKELNQYMIDTKASVSK